MTTKKDAVSATRTPRTRRQPPNDAQKFLRRCRTVTQAADELGRNRVRLRETVVQLELGFFIPGQKTRYLSPADMKSLKKELAGRRPGRKPKVG